MIEAKNISKSFDGFCALDNISCVIPDGCIYGLVGTNGAGKSTLLRIMTGVYKQDAGEMTFVGSLYMKIHLLREAWFMCLTSCIFFRELT